VVTVWLQPLSNQSARQGERVTLECAVPAYPAPEKVQWYRNEVEIFTSPDYTISFSLGLCTLVIAEVFPEDAGTYRCMITVNGVPNSTSMYLNVAGQYSALADIGGGQGDHCPPPNSQQPTVTRDSI